MTVSLIKCLLKMKKLTSQFHFLTWMLVSMTINFLVSFLPLGITTSTFLWFVLVALPTADKFSQSACVFAPTRCVIQEHVYQRHQWTMKADATTRLWINKTCITNVVLEGLDVELYNVWGDGECKSWCKVWARFSKVVLR